jgi:hypothetical protein
MMKRGSKDNLGELVDNLATELITADAQLAQAEGPEFQRKAMLRALKAVESFVGKAMAYQGTYAIGQLRHHLTNADLGHKSKVFTPPAHRPLDPKSVAAFKATAAAALALKMSKGCKEEDAAKWVSRQMAKAKVKVTTVNLTTWRDKFSRGEPGREWFDRMLAQGVDDPGYPP